METTPALATGYLRKAQAEIQALQSQVVVEKAIANSLLGGLLANAIRWGTRCRKESATTSSGSNPPNTVFMAATVDGHGENTSCDQELFTSSINKD
jgi:hypothetical protein